MFMVPNIVQNKNEISNSDWYQSTGDCTFFVGDSCWTL